MGLAAGVLRASFFHRRMALAGSPVTVLLFLYSSCRTVNGLWISASWVGVGRSPGYSHLGTREVKRSDLVYRERRNVAWVLAIDRFCVPSSVLSKCLPGSSLFITSAPPSRLVLVPISALQRRKRRLPGRRKLSHSRRHANKYQIRNFIGMA